MTHSDIKIYPILKSIQMLDISDEEYFSDKYRDYISNSRLKLINPKEDGSPELFEAGLKSSFNSSFIFGSAVHEMVLQPEEFEIIQNVDKPTAKMGAMADELFKIYPKITDSDIIKASDKVDYYKGKMDDKKIKNVVDKCSQYWEARSKCKPSKEPIFLDSKSREKVELCIKSVNDCKAIQKLLHPVGIVTTPKSYNEATIILDVKCVTPSKEELVLKLKGKLDNFTVNYDSEIITLNDLKTTGHYIEDFGSKSFFHFHYFRQMGMYNWMLACLNNQLFKFKNPTYKCNMLLVSTIPPFNSGVFKVNGKHIQKGVSEFSDLLKRVAFYRLYGK